MSANRVVWRAIALGLLVLFLLAGAYNGLVEGVSATRYADTPGMQMATVTQLLYGASALAALAALAFRRAWALWPVLGFAVAATATAGLAPVVYGGALVRTGVLTGAAVAVLLGLVIWAWRRTAPPLAPNR